MTTETATSAPGMPCGACDAQVPAHVTLAPVERLLELLATEPATISQAEARRIAAEAPAEKLVALLSHKLDSVVAQTVLILAHRGGEDAVDALVHLAHTTRLPAIREVAVRTLARCGPRGRARLLELSQRAATVDHAMKGLREAALLPSFRPAALARLAELADDGRLPSEARLDAAVAVLRNGWASGAESVRRALARAKAADLAEQWEKEGCAASPLDTLSDALGTFNPDFESWITRASSEKAAARESAAQAWDERVRAEARERSAATAEAPSPSVRVGRNDPCPCGSGKKHKKCCGGSTAPAETSLASAVLAFPLGFRGVAVSPFERPEEEQALLARFLLARDAGQLPDLLPGQPYLAWGAVRRLLCLRSHARAVRLTLAILRDWDREPGLDYLEVLGAFVGVVCQFQPALLPEALALAARHAPPWGVRDVAAAVAAARHDVGLFLPGLLEHRSDDLAALLAWCAVYARFGSRSVTDAHAAQLRALDDILSRHVELEYVRQARQCLEGALQTVRDEEASTSSPAEGPVPSDEAGAAELEAWPSLAGEMDGETFAGVLAAEARLAALRAGLAPPSEPLEEAALGPWERECAIRREAIEATLEQSKPLRQRATDSIVAALRAHPHEMGICPLESVVGWLLPEGCTLEVACAVAYAAGLFEGRAPAGASELLSWGDRLALKQDFHLADPTPFLGAARAALVDAFAAHGLVTPGMFEIPSAAVTWLPLGEAVLPGPADHPLALEAAREGLPVLELAQRRGVEGKPLVP